MIPDVGRVGPANDRDRSVRPIIKTIGPITQYHLNFHAKYWAGNWNK